VFRMLLFVLWLWLVYVFGLWVSMRIGIWYRLAHLSCTLRGVGLVWLVEEEVGLLETIPLG
jgi:hypothetical protein